jgi:hypothetical protein
MAAMPPRSWMPKSSSPSQTEPSCRLAFMQCRVVFAVGDRPQATSRSQRTAQTASDGKAHREFD